MGYDCLYNKVDFMIDMDIVIKFFFICYGLLYMTSINGEKLERIIKKYIYNNINDFKE